MRRGQEEEPIKVTRSIIFSRPRSSSQLPFPPSALELVFDRLGSLIRSQTETAGRLERKQTDNLKN